MKEKAIEICKNITKTLDTMGHANTIASENAMFKPTRITREILIKKRNELKKKYNI